MLCTLWICCCCSTVKAAGSVAAAVSAAVVHSLVADPSIPSKVTAKVHSVTAASSNATAPSSTHYRSAVATPSVEAAGSVVAALSAAVIHSFVVDLSMPSEATAEAHFIAAASCTTAAPSSTFYGSVVAAPSVEAAGSANAAPSLRLHCQPFSLHLPVLIHLSLLLDALLLHPHVLCVTV
jgi:hypothetical protein